MAKMNYWRAGKLYRRSSLDIRYENDVPDRAERWLRAVERNQQQRHQTRAAGSVAPSTDGVTASSTAAVSW